MSNFSLTLRGLALMLLMWVFEGAGIPVVEGQVETFIVVVGQLVAAGAIYYGRFRQGDIDMLGRK